MPNQGWLYSVEQARKPIEFTSDVPTLNSLARRILGKGDDDLITEFQG